LCSEVTSIATLNNDLQQNQYAAQNQTSNGQGNNPPTTAGTSAAGGSGTGIGVGSSTAPQVQQNQAPQANNGYTDVGSYLNANQQGGNQLGSQIASNLNTGYQNTQNAINNSVNTANSSINSGYTPENTQLIQQVAANPTAAASSPDQLSQFQGQLNDTYAGPTSWADYGTQQGNVATAQQNASLVNAPGGNNALVQQVENQLNPGQSGQGVNALDTLLFQGNPNAVNTAQTAANQYNNLNDYLNQANIGVNNNITAAQNNAAQTSQDALNAFTGANGTLTNLNTNINNTAATDLSQAQAQQTQIQQDLANIYGGQQQQTAGTTLGTYGGGTTPWGNTTNYTIGNLSPQDLQALGMTQDQWNQLQGALQQAGTSTMANGHNFAAPSETSQIDLSQYLNQLNPATAINAGTVATPQQYQEVAAINQLLGSQAPTQTEAINPLNASEAGTYNPNGLNQFNYQAALSNAQNTAQQEQAAAQQEAAALTGQADLAHAQSQHNGGMFSSINNFLHSAAPIVANPTLALGEATLPKKGI
jgi:hypothetical protein